MWKAHENRKVKFRICQNSRYFPIPKQSWSFPNIALKDIAEGTDNKSDKECSESDKEKISSTEIRETSEDKRDDEKFDETAGKSVVRKRGRRARNTIENVVA